MTDIVERLRAASYGSHGLKAEAADELERLRAALAWYANTENYNTGQDCPDVLIEGGKIARDALETKP